VGESDWGTGSSLCAITLLDRHFAVFGSFASAPMAVAVQDNKVPQAIQFPALIRATTEQGAGM